MTPSSSTAPTFSSAAILLAILPTIFTSSPPTSMKNSRTLELKDAIYSIRRERIAERMKGLQELVPNGNKVKPGLPYLDIIRLLRDNSSLPIAAYQVSGEYSMIKAGGVLKMIDEEKVMMESLMCLRRAGADIILTYFALQAAKCLCGEKR